GPPELRDLLREKRAQAVPDDHGLFAQRVEARERVVEIVAKAKARRPLGPETETPATRDGHPRKPARSEPFEPGAPRFVRDESTVNEEERRALRSPRHAQSRCAAQSFRTRDGLHGLPPGLRI